MFFCFDPHYGRLVTWLQTKNCTASDKLAFDSLVLLVCGLSLNPAKRLKEFLANCFRFVNDRLMSGKRPSH